MDTYDARPPLSAKSPRSAEKATGGPRRRLTDLGLARAQIAAAVGVSAGTVSNILDRAAAAALTWPLPADLDDAALHARLYPPAVRDSGHVQPDWDAMIEALQEPRKRRRARLTRRQLWVEYRDEVLVSMANENPTFLANENPTVRA